MQRVGIVGNGGSGRIHVRRRLGALAGVPVVHRRPIGPDPVRPR